MGTFEVELNAFGVMIWLQGYEGQQVECGGLDESGPHKLIYLNIWFLVELFQRIRSCGLVGGGDPEGSQKPNLLLSTSCLQIWM